MTSCTSSSLTNGHCTRRVSFVPFSLIEHVAAAEQVLGALLVEDGARVDLLRDAERDARREVRLDHAGDDVDARAAASRG